ncbi:MAG TPA: hypothetical protein VEU30_13085 [Thermoanaerobaculia bacterium]|nr:hypothetical protein [Thermoanaerobaculia bacterium]
MIGRHLGLVLLLVVVVGSQAQTRTVGEILDGKFGLTIDPDNPILDTPLPKELERLLLRNVLKPSPAEERLFKCLGQVQTTVVIWEAIYGSQPEPGLPDDTAICRMDAITGILESVTPPPGAPTFSVNDSVTGVSDGDLRDHISYASAAASLHAANLQLLRRQLERLASMNAGSSALRAKLDIFRTAPPASWPTARGILFAQTECAKGDTDETEEARSAFEKQWDPFLMFPHLSAILGGVSTSTGHLLPVEVTLCDTGKKLRECIGRAGDDPWNSPCWSESADTIADLPCLQSWPKPDIRRQGDWTGCSGDYRALLAPFLSNDSVTTPAASMLIALKSIKALDRFDPAAAGAATRHRTARELRRDALRTPAESIGRLLAEETARLTTERTRLDIERADLVTLQALVQSLLSQIGALETRQSTLESRITASRSRQTTLRQQSETLRTKASNLHDVIATAHDVPAHVTLACGGLSYADCTDAAARRDYDRRVYEAHAHTSKLLHELFTATEAMSATFSDLVAARQDDLQASTDLASVRFDLSITRAEWHDRSEEYERRAAKHQSDESIWSERKDGHDADRATLAVVNAEIGAPQL